MDLLKGKKILVTGVITQSSIAYHVARTAQEQGAEVILTAFDRVRLVERISDRLPRPAPVVELDVTNEEHLDSLTARIAEHADRIDGVVHSIGYAPADAMGGNFLTTRWQAASQALHVSTYSLQALTRASLPLLSPGSSVVGLDFDSRQTWDEYDWMGVAKAGLESCARYLADYLGPGKIRVNLVAAGPLYTTAARSISAQGNGGARALARWWDDKAPLGWDDEDFDPVARACIALLSDWFPATTGEIVHVDGGAHIVGGPPRAQAGPGHCAH
ncbi:Enoyl-[acyl-carrier-protein] reductase [NADH] [Prauserella aidingensis]|uniref:enoyl-ACP reductase FabI n=1 Tax=Prauserella aidingensis TaxID=387890 RepID=UPI0020A55EFE|nr:enoyl-ACP reductase FabI [Prauserella aidingensis]MCP2253729.1 Enoyl-[acyl-carrier-protein] reductase [NADH] [Prauserella aidingensis]